jgi:hypothetical protein
VGSLALAVIAVAAVVAGSVSLILPGKVQPAVAANPLRLLAPRVYVQGMPSQISFVVPATGRSQTLTVSVDLGRPQSALYRKPVVLRRAPRTGRWTEIPVTYRHGDLRLSYRLHVPGWAIQQRLIVVPPGPRQVPPWGAGRVRVRVLSGHNVIGDQAGPRAVFGEYIKFTRSPSSFPTVPLGGRREFKVTFDNPLDIAVRMTLRVFAPLCGGDCPGHTTPPGMQVQWLDAGRWRSLGLSAFHAGTGQFIENLALRPLGRTTFRLRILAGAGSGSDYGPMSVMYTPDVASFPGPAKLYFRPIETEVGWGIVSVARR